MMSDYVIEENALRCPYCGYLETYTTEHADENDEEECGSCGKIFSYDSYITRTFTSYKKEEKKSE